MRRRRPGDRAAQNTKPSMVHQINLKKLQLTNYKLQVVKVKVKVPVSISGPVKGTVPRRRGGTARPPDSTRAGKWLSRKYKVAFAEIINKIN